MGKYSYSEIKKSRDEGYKDGISRGSGQGKRDMLAKLRVWLTEEERRLNR